MAVHRSQLTRLLYIDKAIRGGTHPNANTIAREYEVSPRTVARDIEYMRDMLDAPIGYNESRKGYYYTEPNYHLPSVDIRESELFAVCVAEKALEQYAGTPLYDSLTSVFDKIRSYLPETIRVNTTWIDSRVSFLEPSRPVMSPEVWETVARALQTRSVLAIVHRAPGREPVAREVEAYHLAASQGQWYLIARCRLKDEVRTFAISRIETATTTSAHYIIPDDFDFKAYMGANFGIMAEAEEYTARIRFGPAQAPYVRERIWHRSQRIEEHDDGSVVLTITTNSHMEVKRWVLSWGAGAKVLEPERLAAEVREELREALGMY